MADEKRHYRLRWVDVFTDRPLAGNPLAVVLEADGLSDQQMQAIARETNLSETTFVLPPEKREHAAKVRIFTPHVELPFAGHPTVGTGWVLLDEGLVSSDAGAFTLEEGVGPIAVRVDRSGEEVILWMSHPPVKFGEVIEERDDLAAALGLRVADLRPEVPIQIVSTGSAFVYVALTDAAAVDRDDAWNRGAVAPRRARAAAAVSAAQNADIQGESAAGSGEPVDGRRLNRADCNWAAADSSGSSARQPATILNAAGSMSCRSGPLRTRSRSCS